MHIKQRLYKQPTRFIDKNGVEYAVNQNLNSFQTIYQYIAKTTGGLFGVMSIGSIMLVFVGSIVLLTIIYLIYYLWFRPKDEVGGV